MTRKRSIAVALLALMFCYVELSQAGLVRNTGRSTLSRVYGTDILHIEDKYLNAGGIAPSIVEGGVTTEIMGPGPRPKDQFIRSEARINGDSIPIGAFPAGAGPNGGSACYRGYEQREFDELQNIIDNGSPTQADFDRFALINTQEPCKWEFQEGETIDQFDLFGFFGVAMFETSVLLDPFVNYEVEWVIDGVAYAGDINRGSAIDRPEGTIARGGIFLNTSIDLAPGEYDVFARVTLSSDIGEFFAYSPVNPDNPIGFSFFGALNCVPNPAFVDYVAFLADGNNPDDYKGIIAEPDVCGHQNILLDQNDSVFPFDQTPTFRSETERLIIKGSDSNQEPGAVSSPASTSLILLGLCALLARRRTGVARR